MAASPNPTPWLDLHRQAPPASTLGESIQRWALLAAAAHRAQAADLLAAADTPAPTENFTEATR